MSTEENKATVRKIEEAWDKGKLNDLDALFAPGFVAHMAIPGMPPGLEGAKLGHNMSLVSFPDRKTTIEDLMGGGDQVVVRMQGTNQGGLPWLGVPANGKKVDTQWISIYRLNNGKVVEHRAVMDIAGMMQQLGAIPTPG
jgi:predicted ester cyclase